MLYILSENISKQNKLYYMQKNETMSKRNCQQIYLGRHRDEKHSHKREIKRSDNFLNVVMIGMNLTKKCTEANLSTHNII